jgi:hypothetical protein
VRVLCEEDGLVHETGLTFGRGNRGRTLCELIPFQLEDLYRWRVMATETDEPVSCLLCLALR